MLAGTEQAGACWEGETIITDLEWINYYSEQILQHVHLLESGHAAAQEGFERHPHWSVTKAAWLIEHPTCAACGRKECLTVHHKWPVSWPGGKELELSDQNLITLCEWQTMNCHLHVGHLGDWRSRNPQVVTDAAWWLLKIKERKYSDGTSFGEIAATSWPLCDCGRAPIHAPDCKLFNHAQDLMFMKAKEQGTIPAGFDWPPRKETS